MPGNLAKGKLLLIFILFFLSVQISSRSRPFYPVHFSHIVPHFKMKRTNILDANKPEEHDLVKSISSGNDATLPFHEQSFRFQSVKRIPGQDIGTKTLRVIFSECRESEDSHEKSIFLLFRQNIPLGELIQEKIV